MDAAVLETIATRLEFRGTDQGYAQRSQALLRAAAAAQARRILALAAAPALTCAPSGA